MDTDWRECAHPCWYCRWWGGMVYGIHGLCDRPGASRVEASPRTGCAFYEREPGADDDLWEPAMKKPGTRPG